MAPTTGQGTPLLSVIVATHNRRAVLGRCLDALVRQSQDPATYEVIVADDGSTDGTAEMVEALRTPFELRLLRLSKRGQAAAQNEAIEKARGRYCLIIDDDTIASPELVSEHLAAHSGEPLVDVLGIGRLTQRPPERSDWYAERLAVAWAEHYEDLASRPARWTDCYGANFSAPRAALVEVGGFATDLPRTVDLELAFRLCKIGLQPTYLPAAHAIHDDRSGDRRRLLANAGLQGTGHVEVARRHPETTAALLDWKYQSGPKELFLRRILIAARVPPRFLVPLGRLVPGAGRKMIWMHFVTRLAFWVSARESMTPTEWQRLTRGPETGPNHPVLAKVNS